MKHIITHSCGHTEEIQLYGTNVHGERDRKAAWYESRPCADCVAARSSLTIGSPKQIAYAESILEKTINGITERVINREKPARMTDEAYDEAQDTARSIIAAMRAETSARVILDNQHDLTNYYRAKLESEQAS